MAEEEEKNEQSITEALAGDDEGGSGGLLSKILRLAMPVGILVLAAGAGYFANQMVGGSSGTPSKAAAEEEPPPPSDDEEYTYYVMDSIVANLNVPRLERYINVTLTLAIRNEDYKKASKVIEKKMPELKNSLILYLSDCSLDEIRGKKNLNRILREIQDSFNERLWPDQRPLIVKIGYERWVIQ